MAGDVERLLHPGPGAGGWQHRAGIECVATPGQTGVPGVWPAVQALAGRPGLDIPSEVDGVRNGRHWSGVRSEPLLLEADARQRERAAYGRRSGENVAHRSAPAPRR